VWSFRAGSPISRAQHQRLAFASAPPAGIADLVGAALIVGLMGFGGVVFSASGVRDLLTRPRVACQPHPRVSYPRKMGVWIYFGRGGIVAPTEDVAQAVAQVVRATLATLLSGGVATVATVGAVVVAMI